MMPHNDEDVESHKSYSWHIPRWVDVATESLLFVLFGVCAGVLVIPGDGNPGHLLFVVGVCGSCSMVFWQRRKASLGTTIALCGALVVISWPVAIGLRDHADVLMPDRGVGLALLAWLQRVLPATLFCVGIVRWIQTRQRLVMVLAAIPLCLQLAYFSLRTPLTDSVARLERCGIAVAGTPTDGYGIFLVRNQDDNAIHAAFDDLKTLSRLTTAHVQSKRITDDGISLLSRLPELECLQLDSTSISRRGLECVAQMPRLHRLALFRVAFDDRDIACLGSSQSLETLIVGDCGLGDEVIEHIAKFKMLKRVSFSNTAITPRAIHRLETERPELEVDFPDRKGSLPSSSPK